jgi:uncharacterized protein
MRMLLIFIALAIIILVIKRLWLQPRVTPQTRRQLSGQMVQCKHCGMYIPDSEAVRNQNQWYCSKEHRDADHQGDAEENR